MYECEFVTAVMLLFLLCVTSNRSSMKTFFRTTSHRIRFEHSEHDHNSPSKPMITRSRGNTRSALPFVEILRGPQEGVREQLVHSWPLGRITMQTGHQHTRARGVDHSREINHMLRVRDSLEAIAWISRVNASERLVEDAARSPHVRFGTQLTTNAKNKARTTRKNEPEIAC